MESVNVDAQRTVNLILEQNGPDAKSSFAMMNRPGLAAFATLPGTRNRGVFRYEDGATERLFSVSGTRFSEVLSDGTVFNRGAVVDDGLPGTICANNANQLCVTSGGRLYIFDVGTNTLTEIDSTGGPALQGRVQMAVFCDGYFIALLVDGRIQVSALEDGLTWNPAQIALPSRLQGPARAMFIDHNEVFLLSATRGMVYWDSGNTFPFDPAPGANLQVGAWAPFINGYFGWATLDNATFAVLADERGDPYAARFDGYRPQRISTHAQENAWRKYSTNLNGPVECYGYREAGHSFLVCWFPDGDATWVYDVATGMWTEWSWRDSASGLDLAHRSCNHVYVFGKHIVGDTQSGNLLEMSLPQVSGSGWTFCDDLGSPLIRYRRAPHVSNEQQRIFHESLQLDMEVGLGPEPPLAGFIAPGTMGPTSIVLQDANGVNWTVTIADDGTITTVSGAAGPPNDIVINGTSIATTWRLTISTLGVIGAQGIVFDVTKRASYPMLTATTQYQSALLVSDLGVVAALSPATGARGPQVMLRWSDDGAHTWSNVYTRDCGQAGEYAKRVIWRRLGSSRDRVYEVSFSDPVPMRIVDAYLKTNLDPEPVERLVAKLRKQA
jgi:hypothetical protein